MAIGIKIEYSIPSTYKGEKLAKELESKLKEISEVSTRINTQRIIVTAKLYSQLAVDPDKEIERWKE